MADSMTSSEFILRIDAPTDALTLILEDDNRVAYAYLLRGEKIVSDVWLYNVAATPETTNWNDSRELPFLNPAKYCQPGTIPRLTMESIIQCHWHAEAVDVFVDGIAWARLECGKKPAWSRWAMREGPLARPLDGE